MSCPIKVFVVPTKEKAVELYDKYGGGSWKSSNRVFFDRDGEDWIVRVHLHEEEGEIQ